MRKSILWFVFLTLLTIQSAFAQSFYVTLIPQHYSLTLFISA